MYFTLFIFSLLAHGILSVEIFTCENNKVNIECPENTFFRVYNATYGRQNSTICPRKGLDSNTNCSSKNATQIIEQRCFGGNNCTFVVSNEMFTDPCVGTYKYLDLNYSCQPRIPGYIGPLPRPGGPYPLCGPNEQLQYNNCCRYCLSRIWRPCIRRCVCKVGYKRDPNTGRCVANKYYPQPGTQCQTHEVYSECGGGCEKTCTNRQPICTQQCVSGYVCAQNYVRDTNSSKCVLPDDCSSVPPILP